ncbi:hypothetical protein PF006_g15420 [Phytophthora fragariae]|uniref:RRM domain-containing protein n=1 Tax=Phytophthora fragariae TaxID=53985 RepID=A0A6A3T8F4_9STRA|nr:hypothetical protein PF006_g15420 [Phytophthora fragariae]
MGGEEQALAVTEEACRVYVGNLLPKAKEVHLTSKFSRFGTIHSVWIARRPPGFAFVRFATPDAAQRAVGECREDGAMEILGKAVRVQMAGHKDRNHSIGGEGQQSQAESQDRASQGDPDEVERRTDDRKKRRRRSRSPRCRSRSSDSHGRLRHRSRSRSSGGVNHYM